MYVYLCASISNLYCVKIYAITVIVCNEYDADEVDDEVEDERKKKKERRRKKNS